MEDSSRDMEQEGAEQPESGGFGGGEGKSDDDGGALESGGDGAAGAGDSPDDETPSDSPLSGGEMADAPKEDVEEATFSGRKEREGAVLYDATEEELKAAEKVGEVEDLLGGEAVEGDVEVAEEAAPVAKPVDEPVAAEKPATEVAAAPAQAEVVEEVIEEEPEVLEEVVEEPMAEPEVVEQAAPVKKPTHKRRKRAIEAPRGRRWLAFLGWSGVSVAVLGVVGLGGWSWYRHGQAQEELTVLRAQQAEDEQEAVVMGDSVARVREHLLVPDEEPTVALVENVEDLKAEQPFFRDAQEGDEVLLFPEAGRVVLYSPARDLVINVGAASGLAGVVAGAETGDEEGEEAAEVAASADPVTVLVLNGTRTTGLAGGFQKKLEGAFEAALEEVSTGNAVGDYEESLVVAVGAEAGAMGQEIAGDFDFTLGDELPAQERAGGADIVVILGADYTP